MARIDFAPGPRREPYATRLGDDERRVIEAAAAARGLPASAYVREVALAAARRELGAAVAAAAAGTHS